MHAGSRWIGYDDVGIPKSGNELLVEYVLHVACKEKSVVDVVDPRVDFCIFYGFRHVFYTDDLTCVTGYEVGNGASAGIEVIDQLRTC